MATARLMNATITKLSVAKPTLEEFFMAQIQQRRELAAQVEEENRLDAKSTKRKRLLGNVSSG